MYVCMYVLQHDIEMWAGTIGTIWLLLERGIGKRINVSSAHTSRILVVGVRALEGQGSRAVGEGVGDLHPSTPCQTSRLEEYLAYWHED